ncbi:MAG: 4-hydroxythreonine-4-phosphate dehydrogenase PdxA [bacterium]|nr:4-hydroxythreonine-4-phosphate dehydrogenase PdxA [bacterium]
MLPVIGISLGDPGGIGPEITLKALKQNLADQSYIPVIFGSESIIHHSSLKSLTDHFDFKFSLPDQKSYAGKKNEVYFIDSYPSLNKDYLTCKPDKTNGKAAYSFIQNGIKYAQNNKISALVTAPVCKESFKLSSIPYTGHTTMLTELTKSRKTSMAFYTSNLKTVLVTVHKPLSQVPALLTKENLSTAVENSFLFASLLGIKKPKIAISGLNPHAGENGMFGTEEQTIIVPFIQELAKKNIIVEGPFPPDTIYYKAYHGSFDIIISLYHDQGLIPVKLLAFDSAVNVTLGLPFIRTSPDHGTAFDIACKDKASPESIIAAIDLAINFSANQHKK